MTITQELIDSLKTPAGGWTKSSLQTLGVAWPPKKGWQKEIIGRELNQTLPDESQNPTVSTPS